jgi:uncharacterized protein (TIGR02145 family)
MSRSILKSAIPTLLLTILIAAQPFNAFSQGTNHTCGAANVHNPAVTYGQVTDVDGNAYKTVVIVDLVWFAENLKVTRFQNGDSIPNVSDSVTWRGLTGPGMCSYRNDASYDCPQGKLYNYFVATDPRNPCPFGWRVPSITDFNKLINFFDSTANGGAPSSLPNNAGGFLKSAGLTYWQAPNVNATNASGFSALPNGSRADIGAFSTSNKQSAGYWYTTQVGPGMGFFLELAFTQDYAVRNAYWARYGICLRCVTDQSSATTNEMESSDLNVFPNPASESIHVGVGSAMIGQDYIIYDLTGRITLTGILDSENMTISIAGLPVGMYFLKLPKTNAPVVKIIKQ